MCHTRTLRLPPLATRHPSSVLWTASEHAAPSCPSSADSIAPLKEGITLEMLEQTLREHIMSERLLEGGEDDVDAWIVRIARGRGFESG